jgi:hypothetical protein
LLAARRGWSWFFRRGSEHAELFRQWLSCGKFMGGNPYLRSKDNGKTENTEKQVEQQGSERWPQA